MTRSNHYQERNFLKVAPVLGKGEVVSSILTGSTT